MAGMRVECPRCKKIWNVPVGTPEMDCNCHLYCNDGNKPSDCSITIQNFSGTLNWPRGLHTDAVNEGDDVLNRQYYCSTHNRYYYKVPITIPCDWKQWNRSRAPSRLRQPMEI